MEETEIIIETDNKPETEADEDLELPTNRIAFSNKNTNNNKNVNTARDRDNLYDDDPFKVKSSWIPDLKTQKEWNNFFNLKVRVNIR